MTISEQQLQRWSNPGATKTATATHTSIKTALSALALPQSEWSTLLQGSYANATTTWNNSDVDVLAILNTTVYNDYSRISNAAAVVLRQNTIPAKIGYQEFRNLVSEALIAYYGWGRVTSRSKCIKVEQDRARNYLSADVVPVVSCALHQPDGSIVSGIAMEVDGGNRWITNYPKQHRKHGEEKNARTANRYKETIRMFKNAVRSHNNSRVFTISVPGFLIEGLLSNVPDSKFGTNYGDRFTLCVNELSERLGRDPWTMTCQNQVDYLLDPHHPDRFRLEEAKAFVDAMISLWNKG